MNKILLLGCGGNAGINFVKSIKHADPKIEIYGIDIDKYNLISSNADHKFLIPKNDDNITKINFINNIIQKYNIDCIHAQPDIEVKFLCENRHQIICQSFEHNIQDFHKCHDKHYTANVWKNLFEYNFNVYQLDEVKKNLSLFDVLQVDSPKVWCRSKYGAGSKAALPVHSVDEAICWAQYWINNKGLALSDFTLSTFLPGREYAVQTFWFHGELIHAQARERLVYFFGNIMPSGQSSTPAVAKTISDNRVYNIAYEAIMAINSKPHGIYCVDMKENSYNEIIPIEINYGRFFTTSDFFAQLGVNTPYVYLKSCFTDIYQDKAINAIIDEFYWIRGLDKLPILVHHQDLI
jgi:carbamoyl-phosphate synthase large subunit